jgi:hypothetical protein
MLHDLLYFLALGVGQTSPHLTPANDACTGRHSLEASFEEALKVYMPVNIRYSKSDMSGTSPEI